MFFQMLSICNKNRHGYPSPNGPFTVKQRGWQIQCFKEHLHSSWALYAPHLPQIIAAPAQKDQNAPLFKLKHKLRIKKKKIIQLKANKNLNKSWAPSPPGPHCLRHHPCKVQISQSKKRCRRSNFLDMYVRGPFSICLTLLYYVVL